MFYCKIWLVYLILACALCLSRQTNVKEVFEEYTKPIPLEGFILCRQCGSDLADTYYTIDKNSPGSILNYNQTIGSREILIQELRNSLGIVFQLFTVERANCIPGGDRHRADSWFPGFVWRPCFCPDCGAHVGWAFEPIESLLTPRTSRLEAESFYGIIVEHVISESCKFPFFKSILLAALIKGGLQFHCTNRYLGG